MAIVQEDVEFNSAGSASSLNVPSVLVQNSDRILYVFVTMENTAYETTSSVKWKSGGSEQDFGSAIATIANDDDAQVEVFRLIAPTTGTDTVYCTFSTTVTDGLVVGVVSLSGVHQSVPNGAVATGIGDDADPTITVASGGADELVLAAVGNEYASFLDTDSPAVELWYASPTSHSSSGAYDGGTDGNVTINWTGDNAGAHWACAGLSVVPSLGVTYKLEGITKDKDGVVLVSCKCFLFKDNQDNTLTYVGYVLSDGASGAYSFTGISDNDAQYIVTGWKDDTPHVFDTTDHVLQPVVE